jgi:hypothetical protein
MRFYTSLVWWQPSVTWPLDEELLNLLIGRGELIDREEGRGSLLHVGALAVVLAR